MAARLEPNRRYTFRITQASMRESTQGTPGVQLFMEELGSGAAMDHTIWLTGKTRDRAVKDLALIGFTAGKHDFADVDMVVGGKDVGAFIYEDDYNGKTSLKVKYLCSPVGEGVEGPAGAANALFGKSAGPRPSAPTRPVIPEDDDSVPF